MLYLIVMSGPCGINTWRLMLSKGLLLVGMLGSNLLGSSDLNAMSMDGF